MLCENCGQRKAEIHLVRVINGACVEENICRQCAEKIMPFRDAERGVKMSFSLEGLMDMEDALKNLLFPMLPELYDSRGMSLKCPHCGEEITPGEFFGIDDGPEAGEMDEAFGLPKTAPPEIIRPAADAEIPLTQAVSAENVPQAPHAFDPEEKELAALAKELSLALSEERYERAAEIRDRVAVLKKIMIGEKPEEA